MLPRSFGPVQDAPCRPAFFENLGQSNVTLTAAGVAFGHKDSPEPGVEPTIISGGMNAQNLGHSNVTLTAASGAFGHKDSPEPGAVPLPAFLKNLGHSNVTLTAAGGAAGPRPPSTPPSVNVRIAALRLRAAAAGPRPPSTPPSMNVRIAGLRRLAAAKAAAKAATVGPPVRIAALKATTVPPVRIAALKRVLFPRLPSTASKSAPFLRSMALDLQWSSIHFGSGGTGDPQGVRMEVSTTAAAGGSSPSRGIGGPGA